MFKKILPDVINNLIKQDFTFINCLKFYFRTLLLFLVFLSFFGNDTLDALTTLDSFRNSVFICWITENESILLSVEKLYLNFEFFILILLILSDRTDIYTVELTCLFEALISFQIYYLLIVQLFSNLHITSRGIDYWLDLCLNSNLSSFPLLFSFGVNLFFTGMTILGYFYQRHE